MTRHRIPATGSAWFNEPRPDRNRTRIDGARLERMRPAGEPSIKVAVTLLVGLCLLLVAFVVVVS